MTGHTTRHENVNDRLGNAFLGRHGTWLGDQRIGRQRALLEIIAQRQSQAADESHVHELAPAGSGTNMLTAAAPRTRLLRHNKYLAVRVRNLLPHHNGRRCRLLTPESKSS